MATMQERDYMHFGSSSSESKHPFSLDICKCHKMCFRNLNYSSAGHLTTKVKRLLRKKICFLLYFILELSKPYLQFFIKSFSTQLGKISVMSDILKSARE